MAKIISHQENFYKRLKESHIHDSDIVINFEVVIDANIVDWDFRIIEGVTFEKLIRVSSVDIKSGLIFIDCTFKSGIAFREVKTSDYDSTINPYNCSILFSKCKGSHILLADGSQLARTFKIDSNSEFGSIRIANSSISTGFNIKNSLISSLVDINNSSFELRFHKARLSKHFRVSNLDGDVSLLSCTFGQWVEFRNIYCPIGFTLNDNVFNGTFKIEASRIKGFFIRRDVFNKKFELENRDIHGTNKANCDEIFITEAKFIEGADFNGLGESIEKITLRLSPSFEGVLNFDTWKVDDLQISGINQNLKLLFTRIIFRFVLFNNFTNYGDMSFNKCSATTNSPLNLSNSDLGTAKFNEFDLNSFDVIRIDNVSLDSIKASNVKWFDNDKIEIISNVSEEDKQRGIREVSKQLKHALSSSGNQIDSLLFKAREMEAYRSELKNNGKKYSWTDSVIMIVGQTNNFGLSWWKPTWIIFLITIAFYIFMLPLFSDQISYAPTKPFAEVKLIFSEIFDNLDVFWQLFNPARKFSSTYGEINSGWLHFLDLFQRIILGIFIYQIIRGFRKLTTK